MSHFWTDFRLYSRTEAVAVITDRKGIETLLMLIAGLLMMYGLIHLTGLLIGMGVGQ
jgi:hypothetical protein